MSDEKISVSKRYNAMTGVPPAALNVSMSDWLATDQAVRREIVRAIVELRTGIAVQMDRRVGRQKYDTNGFYGLQLSKDDLHFLTVSGKPADEIAKARTFVEVMEARLNEDLLEIERQDAVLDAVKPFRDYAAAQGRTLPQFLEVMTTLDKKLHTDKLDGFFSICDHYGVDPIVYLQNQLDA